MPSVTRKSSRQRIKRRDELLVELLAALQRALDAGDSYMDIPIGRLVADAGISRSTFYSYFDDKGDVVRLWFAETRDQIHEASEPWWELGPSATQDDVRRALATLVGVYLPHARMMAAVYDAAAYDMAVREEVGALMTENIAALQRHIRAGQRDGWIDTDLLPAETAAWLMWMAERTYHQAVVTADPGATDVDAHIDAFTRIVWRTLYAGAPSRRGA